MDSGNIRNSSYDLNCSERCQSTENYKVYTRRIQKKSQKPVYSSNTATTTENFTAAGAPSTPTPPEVSSSTPTADLPTASASEEPKSSATVSLSAANRESPAETPASPRDAGKNVIQSSLEAVADKDAYFSQQRSREQSPSHRLVDRDVDSSPGPSQGQHPLEDDDLSPNEVRQGGGGGTAESQILEDSTLPNNNKVQNLVRPSPLHSAKELLQTNGDGPQDLIESPPLSIGNGLPNGREAVGAEQPSGNEAQNDGESVRVPPQVSSGNGLANFNGVVKPLVISKFDDRIRFNLSKATQKDDIRELRKTLEKELGQVRSLARRLKEKELQLPSYETPIRNRNISNSSKYAGVESGNIGSYSLPQSQTDMVDRRALLRTNSESRPMGLARVNSDVGSARYLEPRPYNRQLSVAVVENNLRGSEFIEKEKRTPKANQYYRNSEFLLSKDSLPSESNKRLKTNNGRKHSGESEHSAGFGFGFDKGRNQLFKSCSSLLQKLMKHKFGWVFNEPVDAKALGLVDYHDIIKHPMDLGTIKSRLSQNHYKSPREFAEDVRLVFRNAMTYNPKGQDVHAMAEQLSQIFEERWAVIETEYNPYRKYQLYQDGLLTPTSRRAPRSHFTSASFPIAAPAHPGFVPILQAPPYISGPPTGPVPLYAPAAPQMRTLDRPESVSTPMAIDPKFHRPHVGRVPVPKKPKAKDPNKRDMTYDEKQRLSTNLQSLPSEKLDAIVQIIKRRNTALSQHDDEIEVDIDNVDPETLWELDRFVTNYKKSLSKNKRKAELALQARSVSNKTVVLKNTAPSATTVQTDSGAAFEKGASFPGNQGEKQGDNESRSSSSSSSSSDSGSSSSDSDSDSSSADGSDAGHSPKT